MRPLRIAVVGGGPTGLYTGILLSKQKHTVLVFEKRGEYTRRQIVTNAIPDILSVGDTKQYLTIKERERYFPKACAFPSSVFTEIGPAKCYRSATDDTFLRAIPIQDLERGLRQLATDMGVFVVNEEAFPKLLSSSVDLVIAADGARSSTRAAMGIGMMSRKVSDAVVFNWRRRPDDPVPVLDGPGTKSGRTSIDGGQNQLFRMFPGLGDSFQYGAIQVWDPSVAGRLRDMNGIDMSFEMVEPYIGDLVRDFCRLYGVDMSYLREMEFNYFPIVIGRAERFSGFIRGEQDGPVARGFLVGDAAMGVHFFSGSGVPSGFELARRLVGALSASDDLEQASRTYEALAQEYVDAALFGMEQMNTLRHVVELGTCDKENADTFLSRARRTSPTGVAAYEDKFQSSVNYCMFMNGATPEEAIRAHAFQYYRGRLRNGEIPASAYPHDSLVPVELKPMESVPTRTRTRTRRRRSTRKKRRRCRKGRVRTGRRRGRCRKRCRNGSRFNGSTCRLYK